MATTQTDPSPERSPGAPADLRGQYRAIGIEALVAALRYRGEAKNGAYAPIKARPTREQIDEAAA